MKRFKIETPGNQKCGACVEKCNCDGFTLVELLVAIAIIGVLAALVIPTISKINALRAINRTKTEFKEVES